MIMAREDLKIELVQMEEDDWFWAVMRWNEKAHGWYNAECGTEPTYDGAASVAKDRFDKMLEKMGR